MREGKRETRRGTGKEKAKEKGGRNGRGLEGHYKEGMYNPCLTQKRADYGRVRETTKAGHTVSRQLILGDAAVAETHANKLVEKVEMANADNTLFGPVGYPVAETCDSECERCTQIR